MIANCPHCNLSCAASVGICSSCHEKIEHLTQLLNSGAELNSLCCDSREVAESVDREQFVFMPETGDFVLYGRCSACQNGSGFEIIMPHTHVHCVEQHVDKLPTY